MSEKVRSESGPFPNTSQYGKQANRSRIGFELDQSKESSHSRLLGSGSDSGVSELDECFGLEARVGGSE